MVKDRIEKVLVSIGLASIPAQETDSLADCGFDSLLLVLSVSAFEKEFQIKIPANRIEDENFQNIEAIKKLLISLGAK